MYIVWGSGGDLKRLSDVDHPLNCATCRGKTAHAFYLLYKYSHVYYVFGRVHKREYRLLCEECQTGTDVERNEIPPEELLRDPVPFSHKYGFYVGLCLLAAALLAGGAIELKERREKKAVADKIVQEVVRQQQLDAERGARERAEAKLAEEHVQQARKAKLEEIRQGEEQSRLARQRSAQPHADEGADVAMTGDMTARPNPEGTGSPQRSKSRKTPAASKKPVAMSPQEPQALGEPTAAAQAETPAIGGAAPATNASAPAPAKKPRTLMPPPFDPAKVRPFDTETEVLGGAADPLSRDQAPPGGMLVGLRFGLGKFGPNDVVTAIKPIYRVDDKESFGQQFGADSKRMVTIKAKPGYGVAAIVVKAGLLVDGLGVYFMKIDGDRLNPQDNYTRNWIGGTGGGKLKLLGGDGRPARGLLVKTAEEKLTGVGLIFDPNP